MAQTKIKKLTCVFVFIFIITIALINAETFAESTEIDFKKTCTNSTNSICSPTANCNITIKYPNSSYAVEGGVMDNNNQGSFNYTLASSKTNELGKYYWDMFCCDGGTCGEGHGYFTITKTGVELTQEKAWIYLGSLALLIFLFVINLGGISLLPSSNNKDQDGIILSINSLKYLRPVLWGIAWLLLLAIFFISSNVTYLYLETKLVGDFFFMVYRVMFVLTLPMFVIWFVFLIAKVVQDKEIKNLISRGVPVSGKGV